VQPKKKYLKQLQSNENDLNLTAWREDRLRHLRNW
jgi:hypothetical protein